MLKQKFICKIIIVICIFCIIAPVLLISCGGNPTENIPPNSENNQSQSEQSQIENTPELKLPAPELPEINLSGKDFVIYSVII